MREIAEEAGLNCQQFDQDMADGEARAAVVEDARLGRERYRV